MFGYEGRSARRPVWSCPLGEGYVRVGGGLALYGSLLGRGLPTLEAGDCGVKARRRGTLVPQFLSQ
jgi:hypothetical protein